jgi:subtilisin-like proprotein convertase family protein
MNYKYFKQIFIVLLFIAFAMFGQNSQERQRTTKDYDLSKLNNLKEKYSKEFYKQKNKALLLAAKKGWKLKFTDAKGAYHELMGVTNEGNPIYYKTLNVDAAISTRANFLHNNGGLGLNIEGQEMTAYVWDAGLANETHQEYDGDGGENRFSTGDGSTVLDDHAAHVMGTIISSGLDPAAKGMAPKANGIGYDWNDDESEAASAAANGMLVSNHSYGYGAEDIPDYYFGAYLQVSRDWDNIMYNAPYYLQVTAAGNDGNDNSSNENPLEGNSAFDKIIGMQTSKNGLTVANGQDAIINTDGSLDSVLRNTGSSEGPTDDLRIKPDIMGNGTGLYSTYDNADDAYGTKTGTSMASPNITGTLLLLQQYYNEVYGAFMKAATLKGLALHTADDAAAIGPDAETGWGLMNAKKAVETITKKNGLQSIISEIELTQGSTYTLVVKSDGVEPLLASISWTDPAGVVSTGIVNDATPVLVNDIDIRVTNDVETFMPWKLTSVITNEKEDNIVDPYERVDVENASGDYTITITHKGSLEGESQNVSLIVTGIYSEIALFTNEGAKTACANTASFDFNFSQTIGGTTTFSVEGQPTNATVNLSETSLSEDGALTVTFGNLENVAPGTYPINVTGTNGSETTTSVIQLTVVHAFSGEEVVRLSPQNGLTGATTSKINFSWENYNNAETYLIEVSESPSFSTVLFSKNSEDLEFSVEGLQSETIYYWRIKAENACVSGDFSSVYSFQTGINDCSKTYDATDFSNASIFISAGVTAEVPFDVTDNIIIDKILVTTDIDHRYVQSLVISLEGPESLESTTIVLLENPCDGVDNISDTTFDDAAEDLACSSSAPAISGSIAPINNMSLPFLGKDALGEWKLVVFDGDSGDGGRINTASITICTIETNTNIPSLTHSDIIVEQNSTYTITSGDIEATTSSESPSEQIFTLTTLPEKGSLELNGTVLSVGDQFNQNELSSGLINFTNTQINSFNDEFKVDVTNGANGWLPNNIIKISGATLSLDNTTLEGVSFWPNPAKNRFNIKMINSDTTKVTISLFDLQGRKIIQVFDESKNNTFTKEINLENISSGIYLISIQQGNKKAIKKIIISK